MIGVEDQCFVGSRIVFIRNSLLYAKKYDIYKHVDTK